MQCIWRCRSHCSSSATKWWTRKVFDWL